jgi:hypothetical protein
VNYYIEIFNNREKAIIIWLLIFIVWALLQKNIRNSILDVLKALLQKKILAVLVVMLLYVGLVIFLFYKIQLWGVFLIKDTVFWVLGTAFVLLMNANKATQDEHYFRKILLDNLKLILILEFIINFYTFNLWVEIILMPFLFVIVATGAVAETKKEYLPVKKVIDSILAIFGISLMVFAFYSIFSDYQNFVTTDNLRTFLLPPLLTFTFLPFVYFFALYMAYENIFVRLDIFLKNNKKLAKFAKRKIFTLCFVNLRKLNKFSNENTGEFMKLNNKNDVLNIIQQFNKNKTLDEK